MKSVMTALTLGLMFAASPAFGECLVLVSECSTNATVRTNMWFADKEGLVDSNRCLQRAREYHNYCRVSPKGASYAYFTSANGTPQVGVGIGASGSQTFSFDRFITRWVILQSSY